MSSAVATTEDITFAEAFTALANYDPPHQGEEEERRASGGSRASSQHFQTFNEISSGMTIRPCKALVTPCPK